LPLYAKSFNWNFLLTTRRKSVEFLLKISMDEEMARRSEGYQLFIRQYQLFIRQYQLFIRQQWKYITISRVSLEKTS
jgi:hypothetical protein